MDHDARPLGPGPFRRHSLAPAGAFSAPPSNHSLDAPIASGAFQRCSIPNVNGTIHSYLPSSGDCPSSSSHHDARPLGPGPCRRHFVAAADALAAPSSDHNQKNLPRQAVSRCADPNVQARPSSLELMHARFACPGCLASSFPAPSLLPSFFLFPSLLSPSSSSRLPLSSHFLWLGGLSSLGRKT